MKADGDLALTYSVDRLEIVCATLVLRIRGHCDANLTGHISRLEIKASCHRFELYKRGLTSHSIHNSHGVLPWMQTAHYLKGGRCVNVSMCHCEWCTTWIGVKVLRNQLLKFCSLPLAAKQRRRFETPKCFIQWIWLGLLRRHKQVSRGRIWGLDLFRACIRRPYFHAWDPVLASESEHHTALTVVLHNLCSWHCRIIPIDDNRKPFLRHEKYQGEQTG